MIRPRVIPVLLVENNELVKTTQFRAPKYVGDPINAVRIFNEKQVDELIFLDITATSDQRDIILSVVEACAAQIFIPLTVGGGVRTVADVRRLLNAGSDKVGMNTAAVLNPDLVAEAAAKVGNQCIVVAIDAKQVGPDKWEVFTHGGRTATGLDVIDWALRVQELGAGEILLTSMDRDGTKSGFDLELTRSVSDAVSVPLIASGGVGTLQHLVDGVQQGGADAVLAASIFHYGEYTIAQAKQYMAQHGVAVRL